MTPDDPEAPSDPARLGRFVAAQEEIHDAALGELRRGRKEGHWMWLVFPQLQGLGNSPTAQYYAIGSLDEARAYLAHPVLGTRLLQCCEAILRLTGKSASAIFGYPDELKLRSCMTLFAQVAGSHQEFARVIEKYFRGQPDQRTLDLLATLHRQD
jgi:uncharacterized protein (DUF1810 family)